MEKFQFKVGLARLTFIFIAAVCFVLFWYNWIDYAIVVLFVLICLGIFSISDVEISARLIQTDYDQKELFLGNFWLQEDARRSGPCFDSHQYV